MRKYIILFFLFISIVNIKSCVARNVVLDSLLINSLSSFSHTQSSAFSQDYIFKQVDSVLLIFYTSKNNENQGLDKVLFLNLNNGQLIRTTTLQSPIVDVTSLDLTFLGNKIWLVQDKTLFEIDTFGTSKLIQKLGPYRKIDRVGSNHLLLYDLYPYHPFDNVSKLRLKTFDIHKNQMGEERLVDFPGISTANMIHKWVIGVGSYIYVVNPFEFTLAEYDLHFNKRHTYHLADHGVGKVQHYDLYKRIDSIKFNEDSLLLALREQYKDEKDIQFSSDYYSKEGVSSRITAIRDSCNYIEKIFPYSETQIVISVAEAGDYLKERDVYIFDLKSKKVIRQKMDWPCAKSTITPPKTLVDIFPADLLNNNLTEPFFYKEKAYGIVKYSGELEDYFQKSELEKFKMLKEKGYKCAIGIYSF